MKVSIEITEGCIGYSYCINGKEWVNLINPTSEDYNINLVSEVCNELLKEIQQQYNLPIWIIKDLENDYDTVCNLDTFRDLVLNNKNTKEKQLGVCEECGDSSYEWLLTLNVEDYGN